MEDLIDEEYSQYPVKPGRHRVLAYVRVAAGLVLLIVFLGVIARVGFAAEVALAGTTVLCSAVTEWLQRTIVAAPPPPRATANPITSTIVLPDGSSGTGGRLTKSG
jgi:hypothetical protein